MNRMQSLFRQITILATIAWAWLNTAGVALAQEAADAEHAVPKTKSWILGYILVILGVALGLLTVCRMGKRSDELP